MFQVHVRHLATLPMALLFSRPVLPQPLTLGRAGPVNEPGNYSNNRKADTMNTCYDINRSNAFTVQQRSPAWRWQSVLVILTTLTTLGGPLSHPTFAIEKTATKFSSEAPPLTQPPPPQKYADAFTTDVVPSDSDVTDAEALVLKRVRTRETIEPTIRRSRYVRPNIEVLLQKGPIRLPLFQDTYLTFEQDRIERRGRNSYTIIGHLEGRETEPVVFLVQDGRVMGNIHVDEKLYHIHSIDRELLSIQEINQSAFPNEALPIRIKPVPRRIESGRKTLFQAGGTLPTSHSTTNNVSDLAEVTIMILYTQKAVNTLVKPEYINDEIEFAVSVANNTFEHLSHAGVKLRVVHQALVNYPESGKASVDLALLRTSGVSWLANVANLRNQYKADLVSLWVSDIKDNKGTSICGKAYKMEGPNPQFANYAFSVVKMACANGNYTFAHEVGHNLGADHDLLTIVNEEDADEIIDNMVWKFGVGAVIPYPDGSRRTIMSYGSSCGNCPRRPWISDPFTEWSGKALGAVGFIDNASAIRLNSGTVQNFR